MTRDNAASSQAFGHKLTIMGLLGTMGIVFGDIGTSPLYVMKTILHISEDCSPDYIISAISCIIWTLTLQTTVKYVLIALRADNKGEGGILALYALLKKYRYKWLYLIGAVGASTLIADGVITPAITVTSAIEGLHSLYADVPVVPIVLTVITFIFVLQQFGTKSIGRLFGPFMLLWFLMLGIVGSLNIGLYPDILRAFNPYHAVKMLIDYPYWFLILGAVFLCTTGAEALYSDLGHCGRKNIAVSWCFVKIALIVNYLGQGAWILTNPDRLHEGLNPFYAIIPDGFTIAGIVMATGAAIIASQALLSGSFTIFSEAMNLDFWPRMRIKYPTNIKGQLYIPAINWSLYVGCVAAVLIFGSSSKMEAAYGLAITITMLMTTVLLTMYLRQKGFGKPTATVFAIVFLSIEGTFFIANMLKFFHGGWFTLLIAGFTCAIIIIWYKAKQKRNRYVEYKEIDNYRQIISDIQQDCEIPKYASNLVYISHAKSACKVESKLLYSIINKQPKRADRYWLLRLEYVDEPDTLEYSYTPIIPDVLISINLRLGFRINPRISVYLRQIVEDLVADKQLDLTSGYPSLRKHGVPGDFRFIIIHRIFSSTSSCRKSDSVIMSLFEKIRRIGISDDNALGLDTSNVKVENVPLIINNRPKRRITRIEPDMPQQVNS